MAALWPNLDFEILHGGIDKAMETHMRKAEIDGLIIPAAVTEHLGIQGIVAEIFAPEIRKIIASRKISGERWLEVAAAVHRAGLKSNGTMLFGHVEEPRHWVDHLLRLRDLQDETGGLQCFIPLAFHPANTQFEHLPGPDLAMKLKVIALARLLLDNVPHVKAYWVMLGRETAQVALRFGADDLDGTVVDERVTLAAGGEAGRGMTRDEIQAFIRGVGLTPVLRDTLYRPLRG